MAATIPTNGLGVDAGLDIAGGNLTFTTADKGVHLGVTSATAANLMDDYEEGTFTPALSDAQSGGNTASIGFKTGVYVKVGNVVTIMVNMFNINKSGMTSSNNLEFQGLPFSVSNDFFSHVVGVAEVDSVDFSGYVTTAAYNNSTRLLFRNVVDSSTDGTLAISNLTTDSDSDINFTITYKTA
jgi:hypothetical protein